MGAKKKNGTKRKNSPGRTDLGAGVRSVKGRSSASASRSRRNWVLLTGAVTALALLVVFAFIGIYPFGGKSVSTVDMTYQYIPFYVSAKHTQGHLYTQSLGMGGNYWALIGYYLTSPFLLLSFLFPPERMPDFMALQELIKLALAGCSFAYFYSRKFDRRDVTVPIFSLCYAMSSFMVLHLCTVIWTDCFILLPLIVLGLDELIEGKRPWRYILCLALVCIFNYYIAYMICIYLLLYYLAAVFARNDALDRKSLVRNALTFAASSLLSAGMAAFILLPSALALAGTAAAGDETAEGLLRVSPLRLLPQLLFGAKFDILKKDDPLPLLYCSVFALLLVPLFFVGKKIPRRLKLSLGGLAGVLMLSFLIGELNLIWHGMHIPNGLPHRFAFLLCFTLLLMAGYAAQQLDDFASNTFTFVLIGLIAVAAGVYFAGGSTMMLIATLVFAALYTVLLVLRSEQKLRSGIALTVAFVLLFAEVTANGVLAWRNIEREAGYLPRADYLANYALGETPVTQIKSADSGIYRIGSLDPVTLNDNLLYGYSGLSFFGSTNNRGLLHLLERVGYNCDENVSYHYKGFTPLMDSVLNLKYVIYGEDVGDPPYLQWLTGAGESHIYRNTLALPRAFAVSADLLDWNIEQDDPFDVQNDFARKASGVEGVVYTSVPLVAEDAMTSGAEFADGHVRFSETGGSITVGAAADRREHIYAYINCFGAENVSIRIGVRQYPVTDLDYYVVDLGYLEAGEVLMISVSANEALDGRIYAAALNEPVLEESIARLSAAPAEFTEYTDTRIACDVSVGEDSLLFTSVPYEPGWSLTVNGEKTDIAPIGGGLIGVPLSAGENRVELRYAVPGLGAGIAVSLLSLALTAVWVYRKETDHSGTHPA